jgi:signal transduction histidine kinase
MRSAFDTTYQFVSGKFKAKNRDGLLFQRLFWGAMTGCLATFLLAESPILESMELSTLELRYKVADYMAGFKNPIKTSKDISIVEFDDSSQFDLGVARFNDSHSQQLLAKALTAIETGEPTLIILDVDLRGCTEPALVEVMKRNRNIVIALFGSLDGSTDLPGADFLTHAAAYGYDELIKEQSGLICRLPINYQGTSARQNDLDQFGLASVPSLTEASIDLHRRLTGVGPNSQFFSARADQPLYIGFDRVQYPCVSLRDALYPEFSTKQFKNRIVLIGSTFTQRHNERNRTPLTNSVADVKVHADAINCLLNNSIIYSFPQKIAHHLLLLLGAVFGAIFSMLPLGIRFGSYLGAMLLIVVGAQLFFSLMHLSVALISPLAVLTISFILGTLIFLDTDLRLRNRELALARESMQVRAEEERQRIAEDLHDETLPALSSVARMADKLSQELVDNPVPSEMRSKLDLAVVEMRRVINDLHPSVLETMGFKPALENLLSMLIREMNIANEYIDEDQKSDYSLTNFTKLQLYRIVQEAFNNVQKHSHANQVELRIGERAGYLYISVVDNGRGIDTKQIRKDAHGLLNIRQRAQLIGAQVEWKKPVKYSTGCQMNIKMPIVDEAQDQQTNQQKDQQDKKR